jgi:hypothetical protein
MSEPKGDLDRLKSLREPFPRLTGDDNPGSDCLPRGSSAVDRLMFRTALLPNGCWEWRGARNPKGYGNIRVESYGPARSVHRVAYTELVGPIAEGLEIDHLCRNRSCINPEHLEAVSRTVNVQRVDQRKSVCKNGHEMTADNTRIYSTKQGYEGRACRACAREFTRQYRSGKAG